jgi:hypothetical protein
MSIVNHEHLSHAINEAKRFIAAAEKVRQADPKKYGATLIWNAGPKDTGATRRASMDLTRALAELRKP